MPSSADTDSPVVDNRDNSRPILDLIMKTEMIQHNKWCNCRHYKRMQGLIHHQA